MAQAHIELTDTQLESLKRLAQRRNVTLDELIREGVENLIRSEIPLPGAELKRRAVGIAGRYGSGLGDLSRRHDAYLSEALDR